MAKLSDVQFSLQGENPGVPQHQQKHSEVLSPVYEKQENTGVRYSIFKLVSNTRTTPELKLNQIETLNI